MTEGKRNIIQMLLQEYDIESAQDIQDALKDLLGGTIKEMMEAEMDDHLGYSKSERSDSDDYRNGYKTKHVNDYYERHLNRKADSYFETREKEDAFAERMVQMVEQKVLANLPALAGMYQMQQSMLMAGLIGTQQGNGMVYPYPMTAVPTATVQPEQTSTKEETNEPEENEFLDYSFGG